MPQHRDHVSTSQDERDVLAAVVSLYEGTDRYRPHRDPPRYGVQYQLLTNTGWCTRVRWYETHTQAGHVLAMAKAGQGLIGNQLYCNRARMLCLVERPSRTMR